MPMNNKELAAAPLRIGEWTYYPDLLKLERESESVKLEPRVGALLFFLSCHTEHPSSREELLEAVWPNRVVGDEALSSAINKLRKAFGDDRQNPSYIETIPKVGYRLIAPVEKSSTCLPQLEKTENQGGDRAGKSGPRPWVTGFGITGFLLLIALAIAPYISPQMPEVAEGVAKRPTPASLEQPTLLILPFVNLSTDSAQDYFADGIVEDVITDLSRLETIRVMARSTSFMYKGKEIDPQQIARELNLSHLVEGSVRKSGEDLRITARLIDTSNGQNLWSARYDRTVADIFEVQGDVAQNIVRALSVNLTKDQQALVSSPPTNSVKAYDLYLKGRKSLSLRTPEANLQARDYYRQAILLDPEFARAYGGIAVALTRFANKGWSDTPNVERDLALHYARKSVELKPESQYSHWALGFTHLYRRENAEAATAVRKAIRLAPGYADGLSLLALIYNHSARAEEAIGLINEAIPINPLYSWDYLFNLGWAYYTLGNYEKAVKYQQLALERNEYATFSRLILVASYMALNMPDEASWQVEEVLAYHTNMSIRFLEQETPILLSNDRMQQYLAHLREAGIPPD